MMNYKPYIIFCMLLVISGCCNKEIVTQIQTQEVFIPVKCDVSMPKKPIFDKSPKGVKELMEYYIQVESRLKFCIGG